MRLLLATLVLFLILGSGSAFGQGCAMCYSTAAAASKDGQRAINRAVMVLLVPPVGMMTLGIGMALWYGGKRDQERDQGNDSL